LSGGCSGIPFFTVLMTVYRVNQRQATRSLYCHLKLPSTAIQIQMIKFLSHKHTSTSLASLYWKAGERTNLQKGTKISVPLFLMIRLSSLNHFKMLQRILYRFHFLRCRMLPRLFQFFYRIRSIIHWQA